MAYNITGLELFNQLDVSESTSGKTGKRVIREDEDGTSYSFSKGDAFVYPTGYPEGLKVSGLYLKKVQISYPYDDAEYLTLMYGEEVSSSVSESESRISLNEESFISERYTAEIINLEAKEEEDEDTNTIITHSGFRWDDASEDRIEKTAIGKRAVSGEFNYTFTTDTYGTGEGETHEHVGDVGKISGTEHWLFNGISLETGRDPDTDVTTYRVTRHYNFKIIIDTDGTFGWLHLWRPDKTNADTDSEGRTIYTGGFLKTTPRLYVTTTLPDNDLFPFEKDTP